MAAEGRRHSFHGVGWLHRSYRDDQGRWVYLWLTDNQRSGEPALKSETLRVGPVNRALFSFDLICERNDALVNLDVRFKPGNPQPLRLTGWQLVVALGVLGAVAIIVLLVTPAPEVVTAVLESFAGILGR